VATDFDRDDRLDGLLRDALRSQTARGACPDAAVIAAWAEGALTPEETAATEAHMAACARCRELAATLATMTESESAPTAAVVPFAARPNGRWKVMVGALGAVAASVLIWIAVRDGSPSLDTTSAANLGQEGANRPQLRTDAQRDVEGRQGQQGAGRSGTPRPEATLARESAARTATSQSIAKPSAAPVESPTPRATQAVALPKSPPPPAVMPAPAPPASTSAPPVTGGAARSSTVTGLPQSTINIDITGVKQADPMKSSETFFGIGVVAEFVVGADLQAAEPLPRSAVADRSGGGRGGGGAGAATGAATTTAPQKPTSDGFFSAVPVRWRLHAGGPTEPPSISAVERSKDGGASWERVQVPATPLLSAGSAPTNTICWLVGRAGAVLLSTDGTTFRQVTKPTEADLISVRALDARRATVRTNDGRTFTTTDGGLTWTPRSDSPSHEG
jgi:hypothetical protein